MMLIVSLIFSIFREHIESVRPLLTNTDREKEFYTSPVVSMWEGLTLQSIDEFVMHKKELYMEKRMEFDN